MRTVTIDRNNYGASTDSIAPNYTVTLTVSAAQDMVSEIFVKQQVSPTESVFACVATVAQLEDLNVNIPEAGTSYFRTNTITLTAANPETLENIVATILDEAQLLIRNLNAQATLESSVTYQLDGRGIELI